MGSMSACSVLQLLRFISAQRNDFFCPRIEESQKSLHFFKNQRETSFSSLSARGG